MPLHYLSPFQNFQLCQFSSPHITSPHHDFLPPNFTLPTFLFHTITPPTLFINQLLSKIPPPTSLLRTPSPQPHSIFLYYLLNFCSLNSSSNIIHYTAHSSHTEFYPYNISPKPPIFDLYSSPFSFPKFLILYSQNHSYVISRIIQFILVFFPH